MEISLTFTRIVFIALSVLISTLYGATIFPEGGLSLLNLFMGIIGGAAFGLALVGLDTLLQRFNLRSLNIATLGLFFGYLLGQALLLILSSMIDFTAIAALSPHSVAFIKASLFLTTIYAAMVMTARASEEFYVSLPLVKFKSTSLKKKDILIDASALSDARLIDLAASGLLDGHLVIPRFIINSLHAQSEKGDEVARGRARRALDVIRKLEALPTLDLRYSDTDISDGNDIFERVVKLARILDANILTAEVGQLQHSSLEDLRVIKFQQLCNSLKPLSQSGECITIKIQRYGKEPRQGVGYLDDGTMVVVNGGAEYIGENIKAQVLSVKHTSSGRMIFCNAIEESLFDEECDEYDEGILSRSHSGAERPTPYGSR